MIRQDRHLSEESGDRTYLLEKYGPNPSDLCVLTNLIRYEHTRRACFPKQATIARAAGLHKPHVRRAPGGLEKEGLFTRKKRFLRHVRNCVQGRAIHFCEFAEADARGLGYTGLAINECMKAERCERLPESALENYEDGRSGRFGRGTKRLQKNAGLPIWLSKAAAAYEGHVRFPRRRACPSFHNHEYSLVIADRQESGEIRQREDGMRAGTRKPAVEVGRVSVMCQGG